MITFERHLGKSYPALQKIVEKRYLDAYPTLRIHSLIIKPTSMKIDDFTLSPSCDISLPKRALRKKKGTFVVKCGKSRHFFQYSLDGVIGVYKANHQIKKDKIIDSSDVTVTQVPFEKFYAPPVTHIGTGEMIARQHIPKGKVIIESMVAEVPAVFKHQRVRCFYKEGAVRIEFEGTAMQNGSIGETILIKKSDGKALRGKVIEKKTVEIQ
ncbi:flagellar basal body P-ring formation chaperone FlgA [Hydrogenimonas cancrithermarum]|nr:flagellar basal body P-ring formation chaperone FlgA [Hydrogenimonas cancrithermarum]